jgi:hypothetical protein
VQLADAIFRRGHLSERALVDICMTGERPAHLDRCEICAERALTLGRWLDDLRTMGLDEAEAAFPPERLAFQQSQILRKLEQIDRPKRVIAFPGYAQSAEDDRLPMAGRGIRPAWVGVAAAAGLALGVLGGQFSSALTGQRVAAPRQIEQPAPSPAALPVEVPATVDRFTPLDLDEYDRPQIAAAEYLDAYTPHALPDTDYVLPVVRTRR